MEQKKLFPNLRMHKTFSYKEEFPLPLEDEKNIYCKLNFFHLFEREAHLPSIWIECKRFITMHYILNYRIGNSLQWTTGRRIEVAIVLPWRSPKLSWGELSLETGKVHQVPAGQVSFLVSSKAERILGGIEAKQNNFFLSVSNFCTLFSLIMCHDQKCHVNILFFLYLYLYTSWLRFLLA